MGVGMCEIDHVCVYIYENVTINPLLFELLIQASKFKIKS